MTIKLTKESVIYNKIKYTRIYFHTPLKYNQVLKKYARNMLTLDNYSELKNNPKIPKLLRDFLTSWNLYGGTFSDFKIKKTAVTCLYGSRKFTFNVNKRSKQALYLGNKLSKGDVRTCFMSPRGNLYLDAKPDWPTYGFGIIVGNNQHKSKINNFPVSEIVFLKS